MKSLLTFFLLVPFIIASAQPGTIDKTYGEDKTGVVSSTYPILLQATAIQPDDKVLIGGNDALGKQFHLTRHNKDGSVDTSFGSGGEAVVTIDDLVTDIQAIGGWQSIAVKPDGRIIAIGVVQWYNPDFPGNGFKIDLDIVVACFLPDGTLDNGFGTGGRVVTNLGYLEQGNAVTLQPDGKIVVAGYQTLDVDGKGTGLLIVRYNSDGSLDNTFGETKGYVKYATMARESAVAYAVLVQPDGKIVAGGESDNSAYFFMVRYLGNGVIDDTFGNHGAVKTDVGASQTGGDNHITSLALDGKNRIVAAGVSGYSPKTAVATRYLPDGSLDNSFDGDGKVQLHFNDYGYSFANTVLVQPGDKLVVSSTVNTTQPSPYPSLALTGLNEDGSPDSSFGTDNGSTVTSIKVTDDANAAAVMQKDGRIVISGNNTDFGTNTNAYLLARFNGYPTQVPLLVRIKRWLHNHSVSWKGLPAENKVAYYSVEQSNSRNTGFAQVAKVSGTANLRDYAISNAHLLEGMNYYRIKAVSTDGTIRYSEVAAADNIANTVSVYPNPVRGNINVQGLKTDETANIAIKDAAGTVLSKAVSSGSAQYRSSVGNLKPGTYYLNITTKNKTEVVPFVKE